MRFKAWWLSSAVLCGIVSTASALAQRPAAASTSESRPSASARQLSLAERPWFGDFDQMVQRRMIRVLAPYSRTLYFNDRGREGGITAEAVRDFEQYINRKLNTGKRPITVYLIPTTRDKLLPGLVNGLGDIVEGSLTVTEERLRRGLATIRGCKTTSDKDQETALLAISTDLTSTCYCVS